MTDLVSRGYDGGGRVWRWGRGRSPAPGGERPRGAWVQNSARYPRPHFRHTRACHGYLAAVRTKPRLRLTPRPTSAIPAAPPPSYPCLPRVSRCGAHPSSFAPPPRPRRRLGRQCCGCAGALCCAGGREEARGLGAERGEIPVASTGMTDLILRGYDGGRRGYLAGGRTKPRLRLIPRPRRRLGRQCRGCAGALCCAGGRRSRGAWVQNAARYPWQARV